MNWIIDLIRGGLTNPKTTVTAIVGAIFMLLSTFGIVEITPEQKDAVVVVLLLVIGWLAGDATQVDTKKKAA